MLCGSSYSVTTQRLMRLQSFIDPMLLNFIRRSADSAVHIDALAAGREAAVSARLHPAMPAKPVERGPYQRRGTKATRRNERIGFERGIPGVVCLCVVLSDG